MAQTMQELQQERDSVDGYIIKMQKIITDHTDSWKDYDPYSPISTYLIQLRAMQQYRSILDYRIRLQEE